MKGPRIISARPSARSLGTNTSVASLIWVMAWISETARPTTRVTTSNGPPSLRVTRMPSWMRAAISVSFISNRHLHDEFGMCQGGDDLGNVASPGDSLHRLAIRLVPGLYGARHRAFQCGTERT